MKQLFLGHSRLTGATAENLKVWIGDGGTLLRYRDLVPAPQAGETKLLEIGCYQPSVGYYFHLGWKDVAGFYKEDNEGTEETSYDGPDGVKARLVRLDVETHRLPVPDGWADAVLMMEVFEHFAMDPMHALWEINRVLKPGGRFILSTPNGGAWMFLRRALMGHSPVCGLEFSGYSTNRHNRIYDCIELPGILRDAGFEVRSCGSKNYHATEAAIHWRERLFRLWYGALDRLSECISGRKREREHFAVVQAVKAGPPRERFPLSLYFDRDLWPGLAEARDAALQRQASS